MKPRPSFSQHDALSKKSKEGQKVTHAGSDKSRRLKTTPETRSQGASSSVSRAAEHGVFAHRVPCRISTVCQRKHSHVHREPLCVTLSSRPPSATLSASRRRLGPGRPLPPVPPPFSPSSPTGHLYSDGDAFSRKLQNIRTLSSLNTQTNRPPLMREQTETGGVKERANHGPT